MICKAAGKWKLEGYDTFDHGTNPFYPIEGEYENQVAAEKAARKWLAELESNQPNHQSGGQGKDGIQDQVFIVNPDGGKYRFLG